MIMGMTFWCLSTVLVNAWNQGSSFATYCICQLSFEGILALVHDQSLLHTLAQGGGGKFRAEELVAGYLLRPQCQSFRAAPYSVKIAGIFFFLLMTTEVALRS